MDAAALAEKGSVLGFVLCSMLATGLSAQATEIAARLRSARLILLALVLNFVVAPGMAWLLTVALPLDRGHADGLLLLGCAAGAPFLPKLIAVARGDLSLAAALMVLLTVGTIVLMPCALPLLIPGMRAAPWEIAKPLLELIVAPLAIGMLLRQVAGAFATRAAPIFAAIGNVSLLILFVILVGRNFRSLIDVIGSWAIVAAMVHFVVLFGAGWLVERSDFNARSALALGTAARNFGAAMVPAASLAGSPNVSIMLVVSAIVGLVMAFAAAGWVRRRRSEGV